MNALVASDAVLIPVKTDLLSIMGIPLLLKRIYDLQQSENPRLAILGILPTMYNAQNVHDREAVEELRKSVPGNIHFFDPINRSTWYDRATAEGVPTLDLKPDAPGVQNYHVVAKYLIDYGS
jgi:chromosome partitioning protein